MVNKYEHLNTPQAEFDFHNLGPLTPHDIFRLADTFIINCSKNKFTLVSFIVGKGIHSPNGPVIKPLLTNFLKQHPKVASISEGKITQGGEGVLNIRLK